MKSPSYTVLYISLVILLAINLSAGQVRLNRGNVLDASPQIGSGRYNLPIRTYSYGLGNLYITGNVTAGKGFKGYVPYSAPTSFRGELGSAALSSFQSGSVGLEDIAQSPPYGSARPYYDPASTILPLSATREGANIPGSPIPRITRPSAPFTYYPGKAGQEKPQEEILQNLPPNIRPSDILIPSAVIIPKTEQASKLEDKELVPQGLGSKLVEKTKSREPQEPTKQDTLPLPKVGTETAKSASPFLEAQRPYIEILREEAEKSLPITYTPINPEFAELAKNLIKQAEHQQRTKEAPKAKIIASLVDIEAEDQFSVLMRKAQQMINSGRYEDAYNLYAEALKLRPEDPLPIFGQVHALIAEGRFRSAGLLLKVALDKFPQFISFRLKGDSLLGSRSTLERRLIQLKTIVARNPKVEELTLLLGYLYILEGREIDGLRLISQYNKNTGK